MHVSDVGVALVARFEGLVLTAYRDLRGRLTVGYGHTGSDVQDGQTITEPEALALLRGDLGTAEAAVNRLVTRRLAQCQFDALVSFTYNVGQGNLAGSTLLRLVNAGDANGAMAEFTRWDKVEGVSEPGLLRRRSAEAVLFAGGVPAGSSANCPVFAHAGK